MEQNESDMATRDSLVSEYQDYARNLVTTLIRQFNLPIAEREEYLAAAMLGLVEAANRYDPSKSDDFRRFAYFRIRGAVIDAIRRLSEVTGDAYQRLKATETAHELAGLIDLSSGKPEERIASILEFAAQSALVYRISLEAREARHISSDRQGPEEQAIRRSEFALIGRLIKRLPPMERYVVEQHYIKSCDFCDFVDPERGLSPSWISRLHQRAIALLREMYTAEVTSTDPNTRYIRRRGRKRCLRAKRRSPRASSRERL